MFSNPQSEVWDAQWRTDIAAFKPKRTFFNKSLPPQLFKGNDQFLPYKREDLRAPMFETITEFNYRIKKETFDEYKRFIFANDKFHRDAKAFINENICITVPYDNFAVADMLGFVPSFKDIMELWTEPKKLAEKECITYKIIDNNEDVADILSTLIMNSNQQLIDMVRWMYSENIMHPTVQRFMKILTNLAGPTRIIDYKSISVNTLQVCQSVVDILFDSIKSRLEKENLVTLMAFADHITAKVSFNKKTDDDGSIVLNKTLFFHPETFVSIGLITDINYENMRKKSFYFGVKKWKNELIKLLFCEYLSKHDYEPVDVYSILPDGDNTMYAYLPSKIPLKYTNKQCKIVTGPSFYVDSDKIYSVCPISLCCPKSNSGSNDNKYAIILSFDAIGDKVNVRIGNTITIKIKKSTSEMRIKKDGYKGHFGVNERDTNGNYCVEICWSENRIYVNDVCCGIDLSRCPPPENVFFAGKNMNISNVSVEHKIMCRYRDKCNKTKDPEHKKSYYHIKKMNLK